MRLQTLEIKGFKSFADKTVVHFNENMTGIVGPNGCGKSNIIDAVRWVLGEQKSSALRLEKMDNLLFNGTKQRPQAGRAEVALTFQNTRNLLPTEFNTVRVSRVLYRTGDSEYRLNNVKCRLKDINSLFLDTGISADSYAIIELKMIDEILNDKENSRRKLFEQAAGISKYKNRKKETLSKLKSTDSDLTRLEDIIFENEANLKKLERQAKRTQKFYQLKDDYKNLSIELTKFKLQAHREAFSSLQQQKTTAQDKKLAIDTEITQTEAKTEKQRTELTQQEQQLQNIQKELNTHTSLLQDAESQKELLKQNIKFITEKQQRLNQQITTAQSQQHKLEEETDHLKWDLEGEEKQIQKINTELANLQEQVSQARTINQTENNALQSARQQEQQIQKQLYENEKKIAIKHTQQQSLKREMSDNQMSFQSRQQELAELQDTQAKLKNQLTDDNKAVEKALADQANAQQQHQALKAWIDENRLSLNELNRKRDVLHNEYKLTKSLVDSLEGFPDSVKYLKKNTSWQSTAEPPLLLDILNCPDEYKPALENYLSNQLDNYVVDNIADATEALQLLIKNNKGKTKFFILSDFNTTTAAPTAQSPISNAIAALSIIDIDDKYQALFNHLLANVYIISDDEQMPLPEKIPNNQLCYIAKSGHFVRSKGWVGGGSVGAYEGKRLGKRKQLQQLSKQIKKVEKKTDQLKSTLQAKVTEERSLQHDIKQKGQWLRHHEKKQTETRQKQYALQAKIENISAFISESSSKEGGLQDRIAQTQQEAKDLEAGLAKFKESLSTYQQQTKQAEAKAQVAANKLSQANAAYSTQNIEFHKQQNRINSIKQNLQFKERQLADIKSHLKNNQQEIIKATAQLSEMEAQAGSSDQDLRTMYQTREELKQNVEQVETTYYKLRGTINETEQHLRQLNKQQQQIEQLIHQFDQKISELKMQLLSLRERLDIEFKVALDDILEEAPNQDYEQNTLQQKVDKIKGRLDRYGEINPLAVESYNETNERYNFLVSQREDLLSAKNDLLETMREIEGTATEKFMEAFNDVRNNFKEVFRSLFSDEDQCDLQLVNPNDPLESTIDIIAKPKGKRPQSINQLSGGEKSLTALALVFSLYLLKPAPFCILDEVDAPLDDTNVSKFTGIIRRFAKNSQFIVVTHNKSTMASVDVIYGVTMQKQGISSVLPVDFRNLANFGLN